MAGGPVSRGYLWGYYESDDGNTYAWRVDADYAAFPERGWVTPAATGTIVYPRFWSPRRVVGHDSTGRRQVAIVATVTADLWTGTATTFTINGSDNLPYVCYVDFRQGERMAFRP
jgi:hypothetical protein